MLAASGTPGAQDSGLNGTDQATIASNQFFGPIPYTTNKVDNRRLLMGWDGLYESFDSGNTVVDLQPAPVRRRGHHGSRLWRKRFYRKPGKRNLFCPG